MINQYKQLTEEYPDWMSYQLGALEEGTCRCEILMAAWGKSGINKKRKKGVHVIAEIDDHKVVFFISWYSMNQRAIYQLQKCDLPVSATVSVRNDNKKRARFITEIKLLEEEK